jgi:hypothetical protein
MRGMFSECRKCRDSRLRLSGRAKLDGDPIRNSKAAGSIIPQIESARSL